MKKKNVICDIDGVILHNNDLITGADAFVERLLEQNTNLLFLTNYPAQTPKDLQNRFASVGITLSESSFYTSAMATADFLQRQSGVKAYVIGEGALIHELYKAGFTITDIDPDFVVVGETRNYNWSMMQMAARFVSEGARFIATNPDTHGPHMHPACGALCAPIERMTGKKPFYVGKPSAWIIRAALNHMDAHSDDTLIIGDNLNTDILAGFQAGLETVLVLSGVSQMSDIDTMPFRPQHVYGSVAEIDIF
ncbi:HAD-IIA family hydrolase [Oceanisphaera avium]|uniref:Ribonucleotide monophosphatase NagD n=1 Tax=Oceanisphaera avium TaxID=1903694 RepID=A0A1Y0CVI6_9GAMM|nr:HAD-IIA family hydrolase [Oceanisphaera avium]ART79228.1 UMP phosphatase [Oceanisphaera avium]